VLMGNDMGYEARMKHVRASVRLNSRVPLIWSGRRRAGAQRSRVHGGRQPERMPGDGAAGFAVGQRLRLLNKVTGRQSEAILIWRGHEAAPAGSWGLNCTSRRKIFGVLNSKCSS